jgi:hypothetical protein
VRPAFSQSAAPQLQAALALEPAASAEQQSALSVAESQSGGCCHAGAAPRPQPLFKPRSPDPAATLPASSAVPSRQDEQYSQQNTHARTPLRSDPPFAATAVSVIQPTVYTVSGSVKSSSWFRALLTRGETA